MIAADQSQQEKSRESLDSSLDRNSGLMPRQARLVAEGVPHHITQRGNNRQEEIGEIGDERTETEPPDRRGQPLMSNHVHLVAVPEPMSTSVLGWRGHP